MEMATTAMATVESMQSEQGLHKAAQQAKGLHCHHPQMLQSSIHTYMGLGPEVVATLDI